MAKRLRVGVIGAGVIAQVMHLPYLRELSDRYEVVALCDLAEGNARTCATEYGVPRCFVDWRDLLREPMDAVIVVTSGNHAPIAIEAARAGLHVLVEKPMTFSVPDAAAMNAAAQAAGVVLMVGYNKRYDLAFARFREEALAIKDARLLRVTTLESPFRPFIGHYGLPQPSPAPADVVDRLRIEDRKSIVAALGTDDEFLCNTYQMVLLDTLVHELNTVRGVLGEPDRLDYVDLRSDSVTVMLRFGNLPVAIHWLDLPGITRYKMEFALFAPDRRATLSFPSPFLRSAPALLHVETGVAGSTQSWDSEEIVSYESSFKRELEAFHAWVVDGVAAATPGIDGMRDVALCQAIIASSRTGQPIDRPTAVD